MTKNIIIRIYQKCDNDFLEKTLHPVPSMEIANNIKQCLSQGDFWKIEKGVERIDILELSDDELILEYYQHENERRENDRRRI